MPDQTQRKSTVLFLCTGNSARSQMGEALLRHHAPERFEVQSAGLHPSELNPFTIKAIEELGISMQGHHAKALKNFLGQNFHFLITVCDRAEKECPIFPGVSTRLGWPFEDPAAFEGTEEEKREKFRQVRDQMEARIVRWLEGLPLP